MPAKVQVLFYWWSTDDQPDLKVVQRAMNAVYDGGTHFPQIYTDDEFPSPGPGWDQYLIAVTSMPVPKELIGDLFSHLERLEEWWEEDDQPTPFEVEVEVEV